MARFEQTQVKKDVVRLVRQLIKRHGFYRQSKEFQVQGLKILADQICYLYAVGSPEIEIERNLHCFGTYDPMLKKISLRNTSLITFLHELRHHLQHNAGTQGRGKGVEEDARNWSMKVFYAAVPGMFTQAVQAGRVAFIEYEDGFIDTIGEGE